MKKKNGEVERSLPTADGNPAETLRQVLKHWSQKLGCLSFFAAAPGAVIAAPGGESTMPANPKMTGRPGSIRTELEALAAQRKFFGRRYDHLLPHQRRETNIASPSAGNDDCPGAQIPSGRYTASAPYTDTGDTTGANNTVNTIYCYYCGLFSSNGPDHVYTFTLTSTGPSPEIRVTPGTGSYNPLIYILALEPCQAPANQALNIWVGSDSAPAGQAEVFTGDSIRFLPLNVPLYLFIDSVSSSVNPAGAYTLRMQDVTIAPGPRTKFDFDRDGDSDVSVFRPANGTWYTSRGAPGSATQFSATQFGLSTDRIAPADFDGDGRTDIAVFRDGTWFWINSSSSSISGLQFGAAGDIPQPADFDGDGRSEIAVFRNGTWYTFNLRTGEFVAQPFGTVGDKPVVGDYDGDGRADYAVYRNGTWFLQRSFKGFLAVPFGLLNDVPVPASYLFASNKTDLGVFRNGTWHLLFLYGDTPNNWGRTQFQFGLPGDIPAPGNYSGGAFAEPAVVRDGIWYLGETFSGRLLATQPFGLAGDRPVPAAFLQP